MPYFKRRKAYKTYLEFLIERKRVYLEASKNPDKAHRFWRPFWQTIEPVLEKEIKNAKKGGNVGEACGDDTEGLPVAPPLRHSRNGTTATGRHTLGRRRRKKVIRREGKTGYVKVKGNILTRIFG